MAQTKISLGRQTNLDAAGQVLSNLGTPQSASDAVTKSYVDDRAAGNDYKDSVRAATVASGTLASSFANGSVIDGVTLATGDRILIKDQSVQTENGLYVVAASGAPSRAPDANTSAKVTSSLSVFVEEGAVNEDTGWTLTNNGTINLGTTPLNFTQFTGLGRVTTDVTLNKNGNQVSRAAITGDVSIPSGSNASTIGANKITLGMLAQLPGSTFIGNPTGSSATPSTITLIDRETPSGSINGSNAVFTLAFTPISGSEHVYLNGLLQEPGAGNDYTISGGTITWASAPLTGDKIRVSYRK